MAYEATKTPKRFAQGIIPPPYQYVKNYRNDGCYWVRLV